MIKISELKKAIEEMRKCVNFDDDKSLIAVKNDLITCKDEIIIKTKDETYDVHIELSKPVVMEWDEND